MGDTILSFIGLVLVFILGFWLGIAADFSFSEYEHIYVPIKGVRDSRDKTVEYKQDTLIVDRVIIIK